MIARRSRAAERRWHNLEGSVVCRPRFIALPAVLEQVQAEVARSAEIGGRIRVAGRGHVSAPLCWTDGGLLQLTRFTGIESLDTDTGEVWVRAGTRLAALAAALQRGGLALPTYGWPANESVGGALSTGSYGIGVPDDHLPAPVTALRFVDAQGVLRETRDADLLAAMRVGLGTLGVVTHVAFRCVPAQALQLREWRRPLAETLDRLPQLRQQAYFEFEWFVHEARCHLRGLEVAPKGSGWRPQLIARTGRRLADHGARSLATGVARHLPASARLAQGLLAHRPLLAARHLDAEAVCRRIPPSTLGGFEYAVAAERLSEALARLTPLLRELASPQPPRIRFSRADTAWLSPAQGRDTAYLRLTAPVDTDAHGYFARVAEHLDQCGGRPLWSTPHGKGRDALAALYPDWSRFTALRAQHDPQGLFLNPYLEALFGTPPASVHD